MEVRNVRWVGIYTRQYREMVSLLRDAMGLAVNFEEETTIEFKTSEGDEVQVLAPADRTTSSSTSTPPGLCSCSRWTTSTRRGLSWWRPA